MASKVHIKDVASRDGAILSVANGDLGNANTSYTYIDLLREGYKYATIEHIIQNTTLTIEACNIGLEEPNGITQYALASATDGTGATITASSLATNFPADDDLIGVQIRVINDATTPANVGLTRTVTDHVGATGVLTLSSALGAVTSGVTSINLEDNPSRWGRLVSDPTTAQWRDVTLILTGSSSHTASGVWIFDTEIAFERIRIKRVTTNATNALTLRLTRGK